MSNTENFNRGAREALPERRKGFTQKMFVDGVRAYIRTGEYSDGRPAEIFIDVFEEDLGKEARLFIHSFAKTISTGLQHGVPLESFIKDFEFDPAARTKKVQGVCDIYTAANVVDAVFQVLRKEYRSKPSDDLVFDRYFNPDSIDSPSAEILRMSDFRPK